MNDCHATAGHGVHYAAKKVKIKGLPGEK